MVRFIAILALGCLPITVLADPIPKPKRPLGDLSIRDGSKHVFRYRVIPAGQPELATIKITLETKKTKVDEQGTHFERSETISSTNEVKVKHHLVVTKDQKIYSIEKGKRIEIPNFSKHKVGTTFKSRSPDHEWDVETTVEAEETIEVEGTTYKTVRSVQRELHDDNPITTTSWRTNSDGPGLVKVIFQHSGISFEATLEEYIPGK